MANINVAVFVQRSSFPTAIGKGGEGCIAVVRSMSSRAVKQRTRPPRAGDGGGVGRLGTRPGALWSRDDTTTLRGKKAPMYDDLKGKTVVVTGSSKGLGAAMARRSAPRA